MKRYSSNVRLLNSIPIIQLSLTTQPISLLVGSNSVPWSATATSHFLIRYASTQSSNPTARSSTKPRNFTKIPNIRSQSSASNPQMSFPCLDHLEKRTESLQSSYDSGPEPSYSNVSTGYDIFQSKDPLFLDNGGVLPEFHLAYETWGTLNEARTNAILIHTGLSASSHAHSHPKNTKPGWWEKFIGPGLSIDTNKFFVVCTNVIGGCYGSTGPSSFDPADGNRYATRFPIITINDMVRAQHRLITSQFKVDKLYASVGASMGGMQSLAYATDFPQNVERVVSISGCARSHPYSIAMRHTQRQVLMADPNWKRGFYYDSVPPHIGMKLSREIATITYRSGPEWENRFGRDRADPEKSPALCPDFLIETYLDHQGEKFCLEYDANSLLYVSKAMDLFDMGKVNRARAHSKREQTATTDLNMGDSSETDPNSSACLPNSKASPNGSTSQCALPDQPYQEKPRDHVTDLSKSDLVEGLLPMSRHKVLVLGVDSDILFPSWQQQEIVDVLREGSIKSGETTDGSNIEYVGLGQDISLFGHDTFLLDVEHVGKPMKRFLEAE